MIVEILKTTLGALRGCEVVEFRAGQTVDIPDEGLARAGIESGWARPVAHEATNADVAKNEAQPAKRGKHGAKRR